MDLSDNNLIYRYWGKAEKVSRKEIPDYHLLVYHCLDVAAVGNTLIESQSNLLKQFRNLSGIDSKLFLNWSTFLLAIHDIGKFADGFQNVYEPEALKDNFVRGPLRLRGKRGALRS